MKKLGDKASAAEKKKAYIKQAPEARARPKKSSSDMEYETYRIPPDLKRRVRMEAAATGQRKSHLVTNILRAYFAGQDKNG